MQPSDADAAAVPAPVLAPVPMPAPPAEPPSWPPLQVRAPYVPEARASPPPRDWRTALLVVAAILLAVVAVLLAPGAFVRARIWWEAGGMIPPVIHALANVVPTDPCMLVNIDELVNGTAIFGTIDLRDVRASLHHHLRYGRGGTLQGIAAQYLQRHNICLALVNMIFAPGDPPNLIEMYNMRVTGVSRNLIVRNTEYSILCAEPYTAHRYQDIVVEYTTSKGVRMEREVHGVAAATIQQINDVQEGRGYCKDTNVEAQLYRIHRRIADADADATPPVAWALPQLAAPPPGP